MTLTRRLARPLLAGVFVSGGIDTLRNPKPRAARAERVVRMIAKPLGLPTDPELLVRANAGVQVAAGVLLASGRVPRVAATVLAASLVPTTLAGHRFWEEEDKTARANQRIHFLKNLAVLGGLILAALDTEGNPSLRWRARRVAERTRQATASAVEAAQARLPAAG